MKAGIVNKIKAGSIIFILAVLILPILQENLEFSKKRPLGGWITIVTKPTVSFDSLFSGGFQRDKEAWINQEFGFRNDLVRINNQLDYWLFKQANAKGIIYGEKGVLHDRLYTDAYFGMNYIGDHKIDSIAQQMKFLQDCLERDNKTLLMVFAAGKATYYSELIPEHFKAEKKKNNYEGFSEAMKKYNINHIDFNKWFLENKTKSQYPLFPQLGIHWSIYGSALAFDSIVHFVEKKRNIDMPDFFIKGVETPDSLRTPDDDIYKAVNLLFQVPYYKMAYPIIDIKKDNSKVSPTLITIGDSFWWNIYNTGVGETVFKNGKFWYYNQAVYPESFTNPINRDKVDFAKSIEETDVIILCYTESTLQTIGNGVLDDLYKYYKNNKQLVNPNRDIDIKNFIEYIKSDKKWMEVLSKKAQETKRPIEDLIYADAAWQVDNVLYKNK